MSRRTTFSKTCRHILDVLFTLSKWLLWTASLIVSLFLFIYIYLSGDEKSSLSAVATPNYRHESPLNNREARDTARRLMSSGGSPSPPLPNYSAPATPSPAPKDNLPKRPSERTLSPTVLSSNPIDKSQAANRPSIRKSKNPPSFTPEGSIRVAKRGQKTPPVRNLSSISRDLRSVSPSDFPIPGRYQKSPSPEPAAGVLTKLNKRSGERTSSPAQPATPKTPPQRRRSSSKIPRPNFRQSDSINPSTPLVELPNVVAPSPQALDTSPGCNKDNPIDFTIDDQPSPSSRNDSRSENNVSKVKKTGLDPDDIKYKNPSEKEKRTILESWGVKQRELDEENIVRIGGKEHDIRDMIHRSWGKLSKKELHRSHSKFLEHMIKARDAFLGLLPAHDTTVEIEAVKKKAVAKAKSVAKMVLHPNHLNQGHSDDTTPQASIFPDDPVILDSQGSEGNLEEDGCLDGIKTKIGTLSLQEIEASHNDASSDSDTDMPDAEDELEDVESGARRAKEKFWQALFLCSQCGILNQIIQKARRKSKGLNCTADDESEMLAMVENKNVSTRHLPHHKGSPRRLRKDDHYKPDGLYGYHSREFTDLPLTSREHCIFRPTVTKELCLPFFCCELKREDDGKILEVENQIKERMVHICHIYHELEKAANFSTGVSTLPAFGFSSIGPKFTFWVMVRHEIDGGKIEYDLRKTSEGDIREKDQLSDLIDIIRNIRDHAYTERKKFIMKCIKLMNDSQRAGLFWSESMLSSQATAFELDIEISQESQVDRDEDARSKLCSACTQVLSER